MWPPADLEERSADGSFRWQSAPEVLIYAPSRDSAQRAANLLFAAMLLIEAQSLILETVIALPEDKAELAKLNRLEVPRVIGNLSQPNVATAAALAAKLSHKKSWRYAAMKHWISHRICSVPWIETHPRHGRAFGVEADPGNHVIFAHAIIAAYSILEELGFEVRASQTRPSTIDGRWNQVVLQDLEDRLRRGGIDLADDHVWLARGTPTRVERGGRAPAGRKASWSAGRIRDRHVAIVDAIQGASWLRSRVSSHRLSDRRQRAAALTVYDVVNVQLLGRRLLLETTGFLPTRRARRPRSPAQTGSEGKPDGPGTE